MLHHYYSSESPEALLTKPGTLAVVGFDEHCAPPSQPGLISTGVVSLPTSNACEVWETTGDSSVERGVSGRCHWSRAENALCAAVWISPEQCANIEHATHSAYLELLAFLVATDYRYPCRFWNYIPNINAGEGDAEEYKKFCAGRLAAFTEMGIQSREFPAASALGHHTQGAVIYAFSAKTPGIQYENPLQERAYRYPREYGVSSPSFSRATFLEPAGQPLLFVSGTASILGHQSTSLDQLKGQLETTANNIDQLLKHTRHNLPVQSLKVYLRSPDYYETARQYLEHRYPDIATVFTWADICRKNLLVEIEAHCAAGGSPA